jgi:hydrogenase-4 component E
MSQAADFLLMLIILLSLAALAATRVGVSIRIVAIQGVALGALLVVSQTHEMSLRLIVFAAVNIALKGFLMPWLLNRSIRETHTRQEAQPYVGFMPSLILGAAAIGLGFGIGNALSLPEEGISPLVAPVSLATVFIGLLLLVTRRVAATQVVAYLVLENGIFVFSLALAAPQPAIVEMGVLLDVFVGVFIMGITIFQINREFDHIDVGRLRELQDTGGTRRRYRLIPRNNHGNNHAAAEGE